MSWLARETWLLVCLAGAVGFVTAWLWQRRAYVPRVQVLSEELALTRRRSAEIENERKQAVARLTRVEGAPSNVTDLLEHRRYSEAR